MIGLSASSQSLQCAGQELARDLQAGKLVTSFTEKCETIPTSRSPTHLALSEHPADEIIVTKKRQLTSDLSSMLTGPEGSLESPCFLLTLFMRG